MNPHTKFAVDNVAKLLDILPPIPESNTKLIKKEFDEYQMSKFENLPEEVDLEEFWGSLYARSVRKEKNFLHLAPYFLQLLLLPHSTAEVERVFSAATNIKSVKRSRMTTETLESLIITKQYTKGSIFERLPGLLSWNKSSQSSKDTEPNVDVVIAEEDSEVSDHFDDIYEEEDGEFSDVLSDREEEDESI